MSVASVAYSPQNAMHVELVPRCVYLMKLLGDKQSVFVPKFQRSVTKETLRLGVHSVESPFIGLL